VSEASGSVEGEPSSEISGRRRELVGAENRISGTHRYTNLVLRAKQVASGPEPGSASFRGEPAPATLRRVG
jgi:hypothetical protein